MIDFLKDNHRKPTWLALLNLEASEIWKRGRGECNTSCIDKAWIAQKIG